MIINIDDVHALAKILDEQGETYHKNQLLRKLQSGQEQFHIVHFYGFFEPKLVNKAKAQSAFFDYFLNVKKENLAHAYEDRLQNELFQEDLLVAYSRFLKNGVHYPDNHKVIYNSIKKQKCTSNKAFQNMYTLASLCKDDLMAAKCFALIIDEKRKLDQMSLLDQEQFKKVWDKRFSGIDIQSIAPKQYAVVEELFNSIQTSKNTDFLERIDGHTLKIKLDMNLVSQSNRLTISKNMEAMNAFLDKFSKYANKSSQLKETFSIYEFIHTSNDSNSKFPTHISMEFGYVDITQKDRIYSLACDLVDFALAKVDKNTLKGATMREVAEPEKFFNAFVLNYALQSELPKKDDTVVKKNKI